MSYRVSFLALLLLALVVTGCSVPSSLEPLSISLDYERAVEAPMFPALPDCGRLSAVEVDSSRLGETIGTRWIEGKEDETVPVTVSSDIGAWARDGVLQALDRAGVETGAAGGPVLRIALDRIVTHENVLRRAGYDSEIEMTVSLISGGTTCWSDDIDAEDGNYGYAGNPVAYQEMLNEALDVALIELFEESGFRDGICSCGN